MMTIGKASIKRLVDIETFAMPLAIILPQADLAALEPHRGLLAPTHIDFDAQAVLLTVQSHIVQVDGLTILVDTCVGEHKHRPLRPVWHQRSETGYLERLAALGLQPEDIDMVMCTHLHVDHVGWNTKLDNGRWVPTFKNAKYVWSQEDFDFYKTLDADPQKGPANGGSFRDSVLPVVEAGLAKMVKGAAELEDGLKITPAPGHTPGTIRIEFESKGEKALFCGDILHHALQIYHPEWNSFACLDQDNARKSRRAAIEHCAGTGALLMPCHFGAPFHCHIDHKGSGFAPRFAANF